MARAIAAAAIALVLGAFGAIQFASEALNAAAAAPGALPHHVATRFGLAIYRELDRVAPAPFVEQTLARWELARGNPAAARYYAVRLPPDATRNELLGRIALARGNRVLAREYFFAAPDIVAMDAEVTRLARADPAQAYDFERQVRERLVSLETHPDAVADAHWRMGVLAAAAARRLPPGSAQRRVWLRRGLGNEIRAVQLSPLSIKYLLAVATIEVDLGDAAAARRWYHRALGVDPSSKAAWSGLRAISRRAP
jgi:hypothetical protein